MVPAFVYSLYLTLYKTDTSLRRTLSAGPEGVRLKEDSQLSPLRESRLWWAKERTGARKGDTRVSLLLTRRFLLVPATSKRLLRRLRLRRRMYIHTYITFIKVSNRSGAFWH